MNIRIVLSFAALAVTAAVTGCSSNAGEATGHTQSRIVGDDCLFNDDCCDGLFCQTTANACGAAGSCAEKPGVCPHDWVGVCGCDGTTYGNECLANAAGVSVDHAGACTQQSAPTAQVGDPCISADECGGAGSLLYCQSPDGACGGLGTCQGRGLNLLCVATKDYVCGCDGVTYDNRCLALKKGAAIDHAGGCAGN
jgi:hypothetical protein